MEILEREPALSRLEDLLGEASRGLGRIGLVHGEAGIGKTALVESFLAAHQREARVLLGR